VLGAQKLHSISGWFWSIAMALLVIVHDWHFGGV
jgi:hypothetical protein